MCTVDPIQTHDDETPLNPLDRVAREALGVQYLFPYQKLVVSNILEGRDQIVILPTGAGKSLCFQFPARLLPGATVIVFPLLSLITDQHRRLEEQGIPCGVLKGGQTAAERSALWEGVRQMRTKVLLTTPEALLTPRAVAALRELCISHLVIDEAHCVSEWGDTFRPTYLQLGEACTRIGAPLTTAFTATASARVLARVREVLFSGGEVNLVRANPDRPNITYKVIPSICKENTLAALVRVARRPLLVFCRTRACTELTCRLLRSRLEDEEIRFYHAGLSKEERSAIEAWFFASQTGVLAATCAYGMGVDKPDIRTVIHRDTPPSVEAFLQESGRAGRDRGAATSYLIFGAEDDDNAGRMIDPTARGRYRALLEFAHNSHRCRRESLLELLDAEPEFCFGCDVCEGTAVDRPDGGGEILEFVAHNRRRYTAHEAVLILAGRNSLDVRLRGLDLKSRFGALGDWEPEDIAGAITQMIASRLLAVARRGPWKHRLTLGRGRTAR